MRRITHFGISSRRNVAPNHLPHFRPNRDDHVEKNKINSLETKLAIEFRLVCKLLIYSFHQNLFKTRSSNQTENSANFYSNEERTCRSANCQFSKKFSNKASEKIYRSSSEPLIGANARPSILGDKCVPNFVLKLFSHPHQRKLLNGQKETASGKPKQQQALHPFIIFRSSARAARWKGKELSHIERKRKEFNFTYFPIK